MLHPTDEERLSAYFDGELSPADCADVERLLRENPAARAWLDQLDDLHTELRSLPALNLERDFADEVLRRAERAMLFGDNRLRSTAASHGDGARRSVNDAAVNNDASSSCAAPAQNGNASPLVPHLTKLALPAATLADGNGFLAAAAAPGKARAFTRPLTSARPYAPAWLAAAASLLLFAGVIALGTSGRNWASTSSVGNDEARGWQAFRSNPAGRGTAKALSGSTNLSRESLARRNDRITAGRRLGSAGQARDKRTLEAEAIEEYSRMEGSRRGSERSSSPDHAEPYFYKGAAEAGQATEQRPAEQRPAEQRPVAKGDQSGPLGASAAESMASQSRFTEQQSTKLAEHNRWAGGAGPADGLAVPGAGGGALMGGVPQESTEKAPTATATKNEMMFSYFSANPVNSTSYANALPVSLTSSGVVVVDVDGAPGAADRIEQALARNSNVMDAYLDSNRGRREERGAHRLDLVDEALPKEPREKEASKKDASKKDASNKYADNKYAERAKDELDRLANLGDTSARVYVVDMPPEQLARVFREVAAAQNTRFAVTQLESAASAPFGPATALGPATRQPSEGRGGQEAAGVPAIEGSAIEGFDDRQKAPSPPPPPGAASSGKADGDRRSGTAAAELLKPGAGAFRQTDPRDEKGFPPPGVGAQGTSKPASAAGGPKAVRSKSTVAPAASPPSAPASLGTEAEKADRKSSASSPGGGVDKLLMQRALTQAPGDRPHSAAQWTVIVLRFNAPATHPAQQPVKASGSR